MNCLGDLDTARARIGAVEGGAATPDALFVIEDLKAGGGAGVTTVENKTVRGNNRCWAEVGLVGPKYRAGSGACRTQNALGGVVEPRAVFSGLNTFLGGLVALWDQERKKGGV